MQIFNAEGGRRLRFLGIATLVCLATCCQAQVSLSQLAKAVAETGSGAPSHGGPDDSSRGVAQTSIGSGTLSSPGSIASGGSKNAPTLEHGTVGPTTFSGNSKYVPSTPTDQSDSAGSGAPFGASMISDSGGRGMGMDAAAADRLATRREVAIAVAGAGGLFLFVVWITTHITRTRRMALSHRD